jgi:hypothetical protein
LTPLVQILLHQKLTGESDFAALCFNYFPPGLRDGEPLNPLEPKVSHPEVLRLVREALMIAPTGDKRSLEQVVDGIEQSPPE